jgi:tetratricopeptide (TPR) repeat protein
MLKNKYFNKPIIVCIGLTLITLAIYWQVHGFYFINIDDDFYIINNHYIKSGISIEGIRWAFSSIYGQFWFPMTWLSWLLDYQLYGFNAGGYHVTNLIFHILNTLLLFGVFHRMTGAVWESAFVAALFAVHPLRVESVAFIAERKDVLSTFFLMLTLYLYVFYTEKPTLKRYLPVLLCFTLGLMSKTIVVTLPLIMILLDYWPLKRLQLPKTKTVFKDTMPIPLANQTDAPKETPDKNMHPDCERKSLAKNISAIIPVWQLREKIPFFILSAFFSMITIYAQYKPFGNSVKQIQQYFFPLEMRMVNALVSFANYLEKTFWPFDLAAFYVFPDQPPLREVLSATSLIFFISFAVIVTRKRIPQLLAGWLWYGITLIPVIGIIPILNLGARSEADRYTYLPSIGIGIMLAWGIPFLFQREHLRKKILLPIGTAIIFIFAVLTWQQCRYWKNSLDLVNHTLDVTKNNYQAYLIRGKAYFMMGQYQRSLEDSNEAIRLKPDFAAAYFNRAIVYDSLGQYQLAISDYNETIRMTSDYVNAYNNRGVAYAKLNQFKPAIEDFNHVIKLQPDLEQAYESRGIIYLSQGNKESGCRDARKACDLGNCELWQFVKNHGLCR